MTENLKGYTPNGYTPEWRKVRQDAGLESLPPVNYLSHWRLKAQLDYKQVATDFFTTHEDHMAQTFAMIAEPINDWMRLQGFWESRNVAEKLMLITTEVAEACEAHRAGRISPETTGLGDTLQEELADVVIRTLDLAGELELDLGRAVARKMLKNLSRPRKHGKAY